MSKSSCCLLVIVSALALPKAVAFEFDPEYQSLATQSGFALIDPKPIDSEYQSDVLTYSLSPQDIAQLMRRRFAKSSSAHGSVLISAGSLSATQFDQKLRAEILNELNPAFRFRFLRTENQNYEENSSHSIFELETRVFEKSPEAGIYFSAYGEVTRQKREDDVGFALIARSTVSSDTTVEDGPPIGSETRAFVTFADFTRSDRNDADDRFNPGKDPLIYGVVHRRSTALSFTEAFLRREATVEWTNPSNAQTFHYARSAVGLLWVRQSESNAKENVSLRGQWDRTRSALQNTTSGSFDIKDRDRLQLEARRSRTLGDSFALESGLLWTSRHWIDEAGRSLFHDNAVPFVWLKHAAGFALGAEVTFFRRHGDMSLGSLSTRESAAESRLNARYLISFSEQAELLLALTMDVDRNEGGAFEGGHGQFKMTF